MFRQNKQYREEQRKREVESFQMYASRQEQFYQTRKEIINEAKVQLDEAYKKGDGGMVVAIAQVLDIVFPKNIG